MKIPDGLQVGRFRYEPNAIPLVNRPARIDIEPTSRGPQRLESKRGAHDSFMDECRLKLVRHSGRTSRDEQYCAVEEDSFLIRKPRYPRSHDLPAALSGEPEPACRGFACRPGATILPDEFATDRQLPFASLLA